MTRGRRWTLVALGVALLVAVPLVLRARPVTEPGIAAAVLLEKAQGSSSVPYSGYVEATGSLRLPVADDFTDIGDLLGGETTMRVWWRGESDWRVDTLSTTGETDLVHDGSVTTVWDYESNKATRTSDPAIRLPRSSDLLPPELARRMLEDATADEVAPLSARSVAGVTAAGFRLTPGERQASISQVDVWVDPGSGLPLAVEVYGDGESTPAVASRFADVSLSRPSAERTGLALAPGAQRDDDDVLDIADAANQFAPFRAAQTLAGLDRRDTQLGFGAVGVYGSGPTLLAAIPLWDRAAGPLREQLAVTPGAVVGPHGTGLAVGPLTLRLTTQGRDGISFLVAGTVTPSTLRAAARQLDRRLERPRSRRPDAPAPD